MDCKNINELSTHFGTTTMNEIFAVATEDEAIAPTPNFNKVSTPSQQTQSNKQKTSNLQTFKPRKINKNKVQALQQAPKISLLVNN